MIAQKIAFFMWGGALASSWWATAMFGYGNGSALWLIPAAATIISVAFWGVCFAESWEK